MLFTYGILGAEGIIDSLSPAEVTTGILTVTLMAFIAAGITTVYTMERLPLLSAILIHAGVLYLDYLMMYLLSNWMPLDFTVFGIFTAIFVGGYAVIWLRVYLCIKAKTDRINKKLNA